MADNVIVRVPEQQFIRGEDGYSPEVTIENIEHGHSVTITDRDHPTGQSFNVMDGDSAYEQAVAGGYTGAEAQFNEELASFKELSDEAKDAAPFYAEYGETTKAEIAAAINGKRQVYVRRGELGTHYAPLVGTYLHTPLFGSDLETGYRFVITEGTTQRIYELGNVWATRENDLAAPAQRAETAAAQALIRMNSADQSAQSAAGSASNASRDAGTASTAATTATTKAGEATASATAADGSAKDAEAYAVGKRGGTDVGSTDPAYHNNAKYYAQQASGSATAASGSATSAASSATAAGNAQTAAETAQGKAEDAQAAAEAVLASIPSDYTELTEDVSDLKSATIGGELNKTVVKNEYVNNAGVINAYNGWDRTDYILVAGWRKLKVTASSASNYNVFYDINKNFIYATATDRTINIVSGENEVLVPPNAYYAIFSGTAAYTEALKIEAIERYADYRDNKLLQYDRDLLNGKQVLVVDPNDLTIGYIIGNDGSVTADVRRAIFSEYYQILRPQNKYLITCPGFRVYICEYTAENGEYVFQKRSQLANGSVFWATTKTTHIRFALETVNSNSIGKIFVSAFCDVFSMRELNDINTYLRVCTFNQAQGYAKFAHANLADATKRKINFLNFIGEYNPDILCAQEALGDYFCPDEEKLPVNNVFNRKYIFTRQSGYQRRTWSKYNYNEPETITFTHQATGDTRFYGKETYLIEGKEIVVLNAHCAYQGDSDFNLARKGQFEELVAEMQQHTYCICCGDFNAWNADEFNVFTNAGLTCSNCGDYGEIDTWNVGTDYPDWPFKAIDNIITTPSIVIQNVVRGPYDLDYLSDHAPLFADLQIR